MRWRLSRSRSRRAPRVCLDRATRRGRAHPLGPLAPAVARGRAGGARSCRLPRRVARVAVITAATNPKLKLVRKLLAQKRKRDELGLFAVEGEDLVARPTTPASSRSSCSSRARPSSPSCWRRSRRWRTRPRRRGLPDRRSPARAPGDDARALARRRSRQRRHAAARRRAFGAAVALSDGSRRPARAEGAPCVCRRDLRVPLVPSTTRPARGSRSSPRRYPLHELDLRGETTFVLGAEREGLPEEIVASSKCVATIALPGAAESLNVAVAGAIALYERSRRA